MVLWVQLGGVKLPAEFPAARNYKSMVRAGTDRWRQASAGKMAAHVNCGKMAGCI